MLRKLFVLLFLPFYCISGSAPCIDMHEGIYKSHALYGSLNTIVRSNSKQTESWGKTGIVVEYDMEWTSDCTYLLLNPHILKGSDSLFSTLKQDTLFNEVVEVNNIWHKVVCSGNKRKSKIEINYFNIDTTRQYKDLNEIDQFKEYSGASVGATFVGYNYAVTYRQHSTETNKYLIAFLEALVVNGKSKFKLLDSFTCTVDTNEKITLSNCRIQDKYDKEIAAIYSSSKPDEEATIVKAWRFSKLKLRIEAVDISFVKYKEIDNRHPTWDIDIDLE